MTEASATMENAMPVKRPIGRFPACDPRPILDASRHAVGRPRPEEADDGSERSDRERHAGEGAVQTLRRGGGQETVVRGGGGRAQDQETVV